MNLLIVILLSSLSIVGLQEVFNLLLQTFKGLDLLELWKLLDKPKYLKPVIFCAPCMASIWGTVFFWFYQISIPIEYPLFVWTPSLFAIALLNMIISDHVS